jgi:PAS domain S-box-containing protein
VGVYAGADHRVTFVNPGYCGLAGRTEGELVGRPFLELFPELVGTEVARILDRVFAEGETVHVRDFPVRLRGEEAERLYDWTCQPTRDAAGMIDGTVQFFFEVTEKDRLARALRGSEERLRLALDAGHLGDWAWTAGDDAVELSPRACRIFGVAAGTRPTWTQMRGWLLPEEAAAAGAAVEGALATRSDYALDYRVRRRDDEREVWVAARGRGIYDAAGRAVGMIGVVQDVTDRKRGEARERFLADLGAVTQPLTDPEATAALVARKLAEHLAADRCAYAEADGEDHFVIVGDHGRGVPSIVGRYALADFGAEFTRLSRANEPYVVTDVDADPRIPAELRTAYRQTQIRAVVSVPFHKEGRFAGGMAVHQTSPRSWRPDEVELLRLVADRCWELLERARAIRRLREQDRRKDEFLATLAHELRNPLAPIRTGLQIVKQAPEGAAAARARDVMERQVRHMVRLIDDLLDISRVSRGKIELLRQRLPIRAAIDLAVEASLPLVEEARHALAISVPDEPLWVDGDLTRLAQVVSNLLNNAAKYTPRGGRITLGAVQQGAEVVLRVTDDGVGIAAEMLPHVFDLFTQGAVPEGRAQGGLGIGLSLVRTLVGLHGGSVGAESPGRGRGSTFTVRLPLATQDGVTGGVAAGAAAATPDEHRPPAPRTGQRVLVVDDNVDAAESLALLLAHDGHEIRTAHTGPEALDVARAFAPEVVFLDLGLPGLDGYEVARRLRGDLGLRRVTIVAVTGWGTEKDRRRSAEAGFDEHLTKPVEPAAVHATLARGARRGG